MSTMGSIRTTTNEEKVAGIIEKLELVNFMCHTHLALEFNPNINFIVGKNGSGKSALMTALMVVLGTKATDTSRGRSLANFIRLGCNQAHVKISLRNRGNNAFHQERYGNHIVLTRYISRSASRYTVHTVNGVEKCTTSELQNICFALNIKLPNPFALMTQETMKTFFSSGNPHDMYNLVREGTGMKAAQVKAQELGHALENASKEEESIRQELEQIELDHKTWLKKQEHVAKMERAKELIANLEKEALWAKVLAEEVILKQLQDKLQNFINKKLENQRALESQLGKQQELRGKINEVCEEIEGWKAKLSEIDSEQKKVKLDFETKDRKASTLQSQFQTKDREIQVKQSEQRVLQDSLNQILQRSTPEEVKRREEKVQKRMDMEKELEDVQATRVTLEREVERLRSEARHYQTELTKVTSAYNEQQQRIKQRKMELDQAKKQSSSIPPSYGHKIPELMREFERNRRRFTKPPIGPIGLYVKVKEQKWALAVESILMSELKNFFCDTYKDRDVFVEIWNRVMPSNWKPTVTYSPYIDRLFDVRAHQAVSQGPFISLMDMLVVDNPVVMNYLIDQKSIEHILLCENLNHAMDALSDPRSVPRNCSFVVTLEAEQVHPAPLYRYYHADIRNVNFMVASKEDSIRNMEAMLQEDEARLMEYRQEAKDPEREIARVRSELNKTAAQLKRVEDKYGQLKNAIRVMKSQEEEFQDGFQHELEEQMGEMEAQMQQLREERQALKTQLVEAKEDKKKQEALLRSFIPGVQDLKKSMMGCQTKRRDMENTLEELKAKETVYRSHSTGMKPREVQMTQEVANQERTVEDAEKVASDACDRIETRHSLQSLQQKIVSEKQFVTTMSNKLQDDPEVIRAKVQQLAAKRKQIKELIDPISDVLQHFTGSLEERKHRYHNAMRCMMKSIENTFAVLIRRQHYEGKLTFNHQTREMLVSLNVKGKRNEKLKNLSGGERSYTTISLILSVWDKLRIPFFMLDEFDVFMDMVNRRICSDMLVAEALHSQNRQFMFFTPQEMQMEASEKITIHKLADPRDN